MPTRRNAAGIPIAGPIQSVFPDSTAETIKKTKTFENIKSYVCIKQIIYPRLRVTFACSPVTSSFCHG